MAFQDPAYVPHLDLHHMPHEPYIRRIGEDWAGITNQKERKRLQNRLNKRASRHRKRAHGGSNFALSVQPCPMGEIGIFEDCTEKNITQKRAILQRFADQALASYATCDPRADHRLRLIQLNTINGLTGNAAVLGFDFDWLICESISPFGYNGPSPEPCVTSSYPTNLIPTSLQLARKHHPWVDLFPHPRLRDNLLVAVTDLLSADEEQQLFFDIAECCAGRDWAGLIVWGEPWNSRNWEVSLPFLTRWGALLKGCPEILEATNYWRIQRGERPISFPTSLTETE